MYQGIIESFYKLEHRPNNVIYVRDGQSVPEVIDSITDASEDNPYTLIVHKPRNERPLYTPKEHIRIINLNPCDFYVDADEGDDNGAGLIDAPFKTISKINSLGLLPGDRVLFKCGCEWRGEQLIPPTSGTREQPITFTSYGDGSPPVINTTFLINSNYNCMDGQYCVDDGDFEYKALGEDWVTGGSYSDPSFVEIVEGEAYSGRRCAKVYWGPGGGAPYIGNNIFHIQNNVKYTFKFYYRSDGCSLRVCIRGHDVNTNKWKAWSGSQWLDTSWEWLPDIPANDDWAEHSIDISTDSGGMYLFDNLQIYIGPSSQGTVWIDRARLISRWIQHGTNIWRIHLIPNVQSTILVNNKPCNFVDSISDLSSPGDVFYDSTPHYKAYYLYWPENPETTDAKIEWIGRNDYNAASNGEKRSPIKVINKKFVVLDGIGTKGGSSAGNVVEDYSEDACIWLKGSYLAVKNCSIYACDSSGITLEGRNLNVYNCCIANCNGDSGIKLKKWTRNVAILDNLLTDISNSKLTKIRNFDGHAIGLFGGTSDRLTISDILIARNTITRSGKYAKSALIVPYNSKNVTICQNKVYNNYTPFCITIGTGAHNIKVYSNLLYENRGLENNVSWAWGVIKIQAAPGAEFSITSQVFIFNNLIANNEIEYPYTDTCAGILPTANTGCTLSDIKIWNNIIVNNFVDHASGYEIATGTTSGTLSKIEIDYNALYRRTATDRIIKWYSDVYDLDHIVGDSSGYFSFDTGMGQHQLTTDPLVETEGLLKGSPCLGAGVYQPVVDVDGKPFGCIFNIGPFAEPIDSCKGTATIPAGSTYVDVIHNLGKLPNIEDISVTPTNNLGSANKFWVSDVNENTFRINVDTDPGTEAKFAWAIRM